ncbi:hypothetical protein FRB90_010068, partial [Tulasnella sp. 427]
MSSNLKIALTLGATVAAAGATAYALSSKSDGDAKTFFTASEIGQRVDNHSTSTDDDDGFDFVIVGG